MRRLPYLGLACLGPLGLLLAGGGAWAALAAGGSPRAGLGAMAAGVASVAVACSALPIRSPR